MWFGARLPARAGTPRLVLNIGSSEARPMFTEQSNSRTSDENAFLSLEERGVLADVSNGRARPRKDVKASAIHHSYPMVYQSGETYLIIPGSAESCSINAIRIDDAGRLLDEKPIFTGARLADPMVFFHAGYHWMFANPIETFNEELDAFRADNIMGPWQEVSLSPVRIPNCRGVRRSCT